MLVPLWVNAAKLQQRALRLASTLRGTTMRNTDLQAKLATYPDDIDVRLSFMSPVESVNEWSFYNDNEFINNQAPTGRYLQISSLKDPQVPA